MMKGADIPKDRALDSQIALSLIGRDAPHDLIVNRDLVTRIGNLCDVSFVRKLNISFNQIRSLDGIDQLPQLKQLLAYACEIDKIECLKSIPKIEMVMLQQNKIYKMNDTFNGLSKLQELRLDQNKISKIEFLSGCVSLRKLDLSFNNIDSLTGLSGLQQLQDLKVSNNSIKTLAPLKALPSIKDLDVSNNQLKSIDGLQQMPTLEYVKADHNMISELKMSSMLGNNKRTAADISKDKSVVDKKTASAKKGAVTELADTAGPMLVEITLSGNRIRSIDGLELFKATLESVDLSSNNLNVAEMSNIVATLKQCCKLSELRMHMNPVCAEEDSVQTLADLLTQACPTLRALDGLSIVVSTDPLAASKSQAGFHTWNDDTSTVLDGGRSVGGTLKDDATQAEELSEHESDADSEAEEKGKAKDDNPEAKRYPHNLLLQEMLTPEEIQAKELEIRNGLKYCKDRLESATRTVFGFTAEPVEEQPVFKARRLLATTPSASGLRVAAALEEADAASKSAKFVATAAEPLDSKPRTAEHANPVVLREKEKLVDRVRMAVSNSVDDFQSPPKPLPAAALAQRPKTSDNLDRTVNPNASLLTDDVRASFNAQDSPSEAKVGLGSPLRADSRNSQVAGSPGSQAESKSVVSNTSKSKYHSILGVGPAPLGSGLTRHGTKVKTHSKPRLAASSSDSKATDETSALHSSVSLLRSDVDELNILNLKITKPSSNVYMTEWEQDPPGNGTQQEWSGRKAEDKEYKEFAAPMGSLEPITSPFKGYQEYATSDEEEEDEEEGEYYGDQVTYGAFADGDPGQAEDYEMDVPASESEIDTEAEPAVQVFREVRLRPDDRFGKAMAVHGGGGYDVRGMRRGSEPVAQQSQEDSATENAREAVKSRESSAGGAPLRRGFSAPNIDTPRVQIDTQDHKSELSESPPFSPAMSLSASASVVKIAAYQPVLVSSAATASMLASTGSLSPRPGPAPTSYSQPKMKFQIPQSARNAINQGASAPQGRDAKDSPAPFTTGNSSTTSHNSALEMEVLRASKLAASKQLNPTTPLVSAGSGPFSPRADHK